MDLSTNGIFPMNPFLFPNFQFGTFQQPYGSLLHHVFSAAPYPMAAMGNTFHVAPGHFGQGAYAGVFASMNTFFPALPQLHSSNGDRMYPGLEFGNSVSNLINQMALVNTPAPFSTDTMTVEPPSGPDSSSLEFLREPAGIADLPPAPQLPGTEEAPASALDDRDFLEQEMLFPGRACDELLEREYYPFLPRPSPSPRALAEEESAVGLLSTPCGSWWLSNWANKTHIIISANHEEIYVLHPFGNVRVHKHKIHVTVSSGQIQRFAKFWQRGISFSSRNVGICHLIDPAGVRIGFDSFSDCHQRADRIWARITQKENAMPQPSANTFALTAQENGENGVRAEFEDGLKACLSPNGKVNVELGETSISGSVRPNGRGKHLFAKNLQGVMRCRMHYDGRQFFVRCNGQEAYIDAMGEIRL